MAKILFVLGFAGSGKTKLSKKFITKELENKQNWVLLDKDIICQPITNYLMEKMGLSPEDRDSPEYKNNIRDLEYKSCLEAANANLKLGVNVICPGPWTKELNNEDLFSANKLGLPENTEIYHIYMNSKIEDLKKRIFQRNSPRDKWKKENWIEFEKTIIKPKKIEEKNILEFTSIDNFDEVYKEITELINKTNNKKNKIK